MADIVKCIVRCDASKVIGTGHIFRCRTIARLLKKRNVEVIFLCRDHFSNLHHSILKGEFNIETLPACKNIMPVREYHSTWLSCTEIQDVIDCSSMLSKSNFVPDLAIIDHYAISSAWHNAFRQNYPECRLLVIDDLADRPLNADWVLDQNRLIHSLDDVNPYKIPNRCQTFFGPLYCLLSEEYRVVRPLLSPRNNVKRLLIFFGGVDNANFTGQTLVALQHEYFSTFDIDVVIGCQAPHIDQLYHQASMMPNVNLYVDISSLAGLISRADLAIGAAGTSAWERASLGLSFLLVSVAQNQNCVLDAFQKLGIARVLSISELLDSNSLLQVFSELIISRPSSLIDMSEKCFQYVDGYGSHRVVTAMLGPSLLVDIRLALLSDLYLYYLWSNDPDVRTSSFNSSIISFEDHCSWFKSKLSSPCAMLSVLVGDNGLPLGQIRFERQHLHSVDVILSFSLDKIARGYGLSSNLVRLGISELFKCWGDNLFIHAKVKSSNASSIAVFCKLGFIETTADTKGIRCFLKAPSTLST